MDSLEKFAESLLVSDGSDTHTDICPECSSPMNIVGADYQCAECGLIATGQVEERRDLSETVSVSLRRATGTYKGRMYNPTNDYSKAQRKAIIDQLMKLRREYAGDKIPENVLNKVADIYNGIQRNTVPDYDGGEKKFVRRGPIKDEILADLIERVCGSEGIARPQQDIAEFMKLPSHGYARGTKIVNTLIALSRLVLPPPVDEITRYTECYLEKMKLDDPSYIGFIREIVAVSEAKKISMSSQPSSRVAGAIYILVTACEMGITAADVERATGVKKNTFLKFSNEVNGNKRLFVEVFAKYNVPIR